MHTVGECEYSAQTGLVYVSGKGIAKIYGAGIDKALYSEESESNARLIAAAPKMYVALSGAVEALRATEMLMREHGLKTDALNGIIGTIDDLLSSIDED